MSEDEIPREWRRWAAVALMKGAPMVEVMSVLRTQGFPDEAAVRYCAFLFDNPAFEGGRIVAEQLAKLSSVLNVIQKMRGLSTLPVTVKLRSGVSQQEFLDVYYAQNTQVLLTAVCDRWPALSLWNPDYLVDRLSGVEVEVMAGRDSDPRYEVNSNDHKFKMPFDEYVAKIQAAPRSNDLYLVANNHLLANPGALSLWDDFEIDKRYLVDDPTHSQAFLWFGPAGTVTPLHHDPVNVMFNQVSGRKHVILIPSLQIHRLYNSLSVYSDVDPLAPDLDQYPLYAEAQKIHFDMDPGETLFIPAGWWHHIEALDPSLSVSFTNFAFDNGIDWVHPTVSV